MKTNNTNTMKTNNTFSFTEMIETLCRELGVKVEDLTGFQVFEGSKGLAYNLFEEQFEYAPNGEFKLLREFSPELREMLWAFHEWFSDEENFAYGDYVEKLGDLYCIGLQCNYNYPFTKDGIGEFEATPHSDNFWTPYWEKSEMRRPRK